MPLTNLTSPTHPFAFAFASAMDGFMQNFTWINISAILLILMFLKAIQHPIAAMVHSTHSRRPVQSMAEIALAKEVGKQLHMFENEEDDEFWEAVWMGVSVGILFSGFAWAMGMGVGGGVFPVLI